MSEFYHASTRTLVANYENETPRAASFASCLAWGALTAAALFAISENPFVAGIAGVTVVMAAFRNQSWLEPELTAEDPAV